MSTLLLVHAHPDDEAISTGGVMMKAKDSGHRVVLVTATRGEEGEIHNLDEAETRPRLGEVRTEELRRAGLILGVDRQEFLGYRDSGMAGAPSNDNPECFSRAGLHEAALRLIEILKQERPEVVVTYTPDGTYGHPDHIRAHQVTVAALEILEREEGWKPGKLYLQAISRRALRELFERFGGEQADVVANRILGVNDDDITTSVDVRPYLERKRAAFAAHVSQQDPNSPFATMAAQIYEAVFGSEAFILHRGSATAAKEIDLFQGLPVEAR